MHMHMHMHLPQQMQDAFPIPSCFASGGGAAGRFPDDPMAAFAANSAAKSSSGQSVVTSVYRTKIAGHVRLIHVSWCRGLHAGHCLRVSVEGSDDVGNGNACMVELRPWRFWRKAGRKEFYNPRGAGGRAVQVFWDLRAARFDGGPEPRSNFYVALVHDGEAVLLLGDLAGEARRRTGSRPSAIEAALASKGEHVFGRKRFATRSRFGDQGRARDIVVECGISAGRSDPEMVVSIDGGVAVHVRRLQWKFRGNETVALAGGDDDECRVEVYWDVHGWLFGPGPRHALLVFRPLPPAPLVAGRRGPASPESCLFLHAWKLD